MTLGEQKKGHLRGPKINDLFIPKGNHCIAVCKASAQRKNQGVTSFFNPDRKGFLMRFLSYVICSRSSAKHSISHVLKKDVFYGPNDVTPCFLRCAVRCTILYVRIRKLLAGPFGPGQNKMDSLRSNFFMVLAAPPPQMPGHREPVNL